MPQLPIWAQRYLGHLGLEPEQPSHAFLNKICRAHLTTLAFENIGKLVYFRDRADNGFTLPPIERFVEDMIAHDFGATCHLAHRSLLQLLRALGFTCYLVIVGRGHVAILVELTEYPGERLYVDCGSAAPLFEALRFEAGEPAVARFGSEEIYLRPDERQAGFYRYWRYRHGEWNGQDWAFNPATPIELADLDPIIERANQPGATFMTSLRCQLWQPDLGRSLSLVNQQLTFRYADGTEEKRLLPDLAAIEQVIAEEFKLPKLPVREAVDVLKGLGIDIFASSE